MAVQQCVRFLAHRGAGRGQVAHTGQETHRVDQQLAEFHPPGPAYFEALKKNNSGDRPDVLPSDFRVYFYDVSGRRMAVSLGADGKPGPRIGDSVAQLGLHVGRPGTVASVSGDGRWRVLLSSGPQDMHAVVALRWAAGWCGWACFR
ncbi:hypothetical protein AB0G67_45600 [Streptomyces sp. NPDC021056]|uniref:hypothetical protein n=1 Tax=Streptomyces sp. NPDC021056 TaxID=3155012 RepID=UPI0033C210BC